jgi:Ca-activated chloride channel family protein
VEAAVEFNPVGTAQWRLIGYESAPAAQPGQPAAFAADLAAAGTATAFYEIVPATAGDARAAGRDELFTLTVRYHDPADGAPQRVQVTATDTGQGFDRASSDFRFASAVAAFGMLLRDSPFKGGANVAQVLTLARGALATDPGGYRAEFVRLVERWREIEPVVAGR